jgi:hypothetical protein
MTREVPNVSISRLSRANRLAGTHLSSSSTPLRVGLAIRSTACRLGMR